MRNEGAIDARRGYNSESDINNLITLGLFTMSPLRLGYVAPDFEAQTTAGNIKFHEWIGDSWVSTSMKFIFLIRDVVLGYPLFSSRRFHSCLHH